jgi:hypothetical protein
MQQDGAPADTTQAALDWLEESVDIIMEKQWPVEKAPISDSLISLSTAMEKVAMVPSLVSLSLLPLRNCDHRFRTI